MRFLQGVVKLSSTDDDTFKPLESMIYTGKRQDAIKKGGVCAPLYTNPIVCILLIYILFFSNIVMGGHRGVLF